MFNRPLSSFVPTTYKDVVEMDDIINAEEAEMNIARREISAAFANTFVLTADETGIVLFENMLNILANVQTENMEFRRQRIMNRLSMSPPFTFAFLKQKLDEIIGVNSWKAYIDYSNYSLYIESLATDQNWYSEVQFTIDRIKPCNMVFINVPYTSMTINLSEEISYNQVTWKYRLGSWRLGEHPFSTLTGGGIIKMPETKSIQQALLNDTANFVLQDISYVLINDTIKVSEFALKQVSDSVATIEYTVTPSITSLITNIKLMRADNTILTQSSVYVPVPQAVVNKHTIAVKESV